MGLRSSKQNSNKQNSAAAQKEKEIKKTKAVVKEAIVEEVIEEYLLQYTNLILPLCRMVAKYTIPFGRRILFLWKLNDTFKMYQFDLDECKQEKLFESKVFKPLPAIFDGKVSKNYSDCILFLNMMYNYRTGLYYSFSEPPRSSWDRIDDQGSTPLSRHFILSGRHYLLVINSHTPWKVNRSPYLFIENELNGEMIPCNLDYLKCVNWYFIDSNTINIAICRDVLYLFIGSDGLWQTFMLEDVKADLKYESKMKWVNLEVHRTATYDTIASVVADDASGRIYIIGASFDGEDIRSGCKYFDVENNSWVEIAPLPFKYKNFTDLSPERYFAILSEGCIILFEYHIRDKDIVIIIYRYTPTTDKWNCLSMIDMNGMPRDGTIYSLSCI